MRREHEQGWIHRQAGLAIQFEWQDKCMESGNCAELNYTSILGQVPGKEIWIVRCDLMATDGAADGEYWWPVEDFLAVYKREDGTPTSRHATDEEVALFEDEDGSEAQR